MEIYEIAQLYLGIATLVAAGTVVRYSRRRSAEADAETRRAFRPLYLFAFALVVYGFGTLISFYEAYQNTSIVFDLLGQPDFFTGLTFDHYTLYIFLVLEILVLAIAASVIMRQSYMAAAMAAMTIVVLGILYWSVNLTLASRVSIFANFLFDFGSLVRSFMLAGVAAIFLWIAYDTRRGTTAAMAFALLSQIANLPELYGTILEDPGYYEGFSLPYSVILIILFITLMGPAMVAFTFLRPEQVVSFELLGYGGSFAGPILVISGLQTQAFIPDLILLFIVSFASLAIMLATGTFAYLYGRFRESRQLPTLLMLLAFGLFALGQVSGLLGNFGNIPTDEAIYIEFLSIGLALTLLSATAIYAAGYRSAGLVPLVLYVPLLILFIQQFPTPLEEVFLSIIWLVIPLLILFLIPVALFTRVWSRMRKIGAPGRLRPLGIGLGVLLFLVIRIPFMLLNLPGVDPAYALVTISFLVSWLAVTGRMDRYAGSGVGME